jgi:hypothetical protein
MTENRSKGWLFATVCILVLVVLPVLVQAAPLPPRTPPEPEKPIPPPAPSGAQIVLLVQFPEEGLDFQWQELWTVVQWQDLKGNWHDVDGWRGNLDEVTGEEGTKTWWLPNSLSGRGPFRWLVYESEGGGLVATSEPFRLPDRGTTMTVGVMLLHFRTR